jgi:hypothetical protein
VIVGACFLRICFRACVCVCVRVHVSAHELVRAVCVLVSARSLAARLCGRVGECALACVRVHV